MKTGHMDEKNTLQRDCRSVSRAIIQYT